MEVTELNRAESDESDELRKERKVEAAGIIKVCNVIHLNVLFEQFRFFSIIYQLDLNVVLQFRSTSQRLTTNCEKVLFGRKCVYFYFSFWKCCILFPFV